MNPQPFQSKFPLAPGLTIVKTEVKQLAPTFAPATFFMQYEDASFQAIERHSLLVVDRSIPLTHGRYAVIIYGDEMLVAQFLTHKGKNYFRTKSWTKQYTGNPENALWGVIAYTVYASYKHGQPE